MKALTTYRNQINTLVAAIATPTQTFNMADTSLEFEDVTQVAKKRFPFAIIYTPREESMDIVAEDIEQDVIAEAPVAVDVWRYLDPAGTMQSTCDNTAADVMEAVVGNAYWGNNNVAIWPDSVTYDYFPKERALWVQVVFRLRFGFNAASQ